MFVFLAVRVASEQWAMPLQEVPGRGYCYEAQKPLKDLLQPLADATPCQFWCHETQVFKLSMRLVEHAGGRMILSPTTSVEVVRPPRKMHAQQDKALATSEDDGLDLDNESDGVCSELASLCSAQFSELEGNDAKPEAEKAVEDDGLWDDSDVDERSRRAPAHTHSMAQ